MDWLEFFKVLKEIVVAVAVPVTAYFAWRAGQKVDSVGKSIDGRMDQLLEKSGKAGELKGQNDERLRVKEVVIVKAEESPPQT